MVLKRVVTVMFDGVGIPMKFYCGGKRFCVVVGRKIFQPVELAGVLYRGVIGGNVIAALRQIGAANLTEKGVRMAYEKPDVEAGE